MFFFDKTADCLVIFLGMYVLPVSAKFVVKLNCDFCGKKFPSARETECVDVIGYWVGRVKAEIFYYEHQAGSVPYLGKSRN